MPRPGAVALLDEGDRRHPVGLVELGSNDETPLTGPLYYLKRALGPLAELRQGSVASLLARPLSMLVLSGPVPPDQADALAAWVRGGGLLLRFAYAGLSDAAAASEPEDPLLPVRLLAGDRQLGGTMSWSAPQRLAAFDAHSPFAGLPVPADVTVNQAGAGRTVAETRSGELGPARRRHAAGHRRGARRRPRRSGARHRRRRLVGPAAVRPVPAPTGSAAAAERRRRLAWLGPDAGAGADAGWRRRAWSARSRCDPAASVVAGSDQGHAAASAGALCAAGQQRGGRASCAEPGAEHTPRRRAAGAWRHRARARVRRTAFLWAAADRRRPGATRHRHAGLAGAAWRARRRHTWRSAPRCWR